MNRLKFVEIDGDNVVDSVVEVTEIILILWEDWSFEKMWLTDWLCDWKKVTTREAIASKNEKDFNQKCLDSERYVNVV